MSAVLRQIARWYNIEVVNEAGISSAKIHGDVERNIPLSKVLANLEKMGNVKFIIEGRKVIVLNS
jgi:transmembrane sensor